MGTETACDTGEHRLVWDGRAGETVCSRCGYTAAAIVNDLDQRLYAVGAATHSGSNPESPGVRDTDVAADVVSEAVTPCERVDST
ncbi:hypothetical protein ACLI4Y_01975 [Natrialbaceae archaeon A-CW3]